MMAISSGVNVKALASMSGRFSAGFILNAYMHIANDIQIGETKKIGGFTEAATAGLEPEPSDPPGKR